MKVGLIGYGRFDSKVEVDPVSGCWEWLGYKTRGYGRFTFEGRDVMAYRFAHERVIGPIPEGLEPDHTCDNPGCVNPFHLALVTHRENALRGRGFAAENARKTHCPKSHDYTAENTRLTPDGRRVCRTCKRERERVAA